MSKFYLRSNQWDANYPIIGFDPDTLHAKLEGPAATIIMTLDEESMNRFEVFLADSNGDYVSVAYLARQFAKGDHNA